MMQGKTDDFAFDYNRERVQQSLSLIFHLVEALMKGKKITLPGISPIPWEPCTLFNNGKAEASPSKDREESEAINNAKRASNSKYKTLPCKWFHSGLGCERGDNCDYIHDYSYKGVMPPPHTYKQKKPQLMSQSRHQGSPHAALSGVTSMQGHIGQGQQLSYLQNKINQQKPMQGKPENNHMNEIPQNNPRGYSNRQGMQMMNDTRSESRSKMDYRQRNYDDYRRQSYRQDEDGEQKRMDSQFYDEDRRPKRSENDVVEEETKPEDEGGEETNEEKRNTMNEEEISKPGANQEESTETAEKSKPDLEEGQVAQEFQGKYYNNYPQKGKRNFDNRDYYNTNYRRDYVNKRGYSDPYYDDYGGDGYNEQGYNNYYGDRGYYGNYYYGRHRNYRHGYYDQGWNRGRGGWRNNNYRYDDYDDDYYDDEAPNGNNHLPDNPYDEDGQEEDEGQSEREEGEVREEATGQEEQEEPNPEADREDKEKRNSNEKEEKSDTIEEGQLPKEVTTLTTPVRRETKESEGQEEPQEGEETQKQKENESEEEGEVHRKERHKRDHNRRDRGEKDKFDRGDRHDRFNNSGRYGPFGGKGRYNKNFNYNNGFFGNQGDQMHMQMMYNIPFMNMMNSNFDLNTMMHFANNFQQYANVQKPHHGQGYDQEKFYKHGQDSGYSQGHYSRKETQGIQNEIPPVPNQEPLQKPQEPELEPGQIPPGKIDQNLVKENPIESTPERPVRSSASKSPNRSSFDQTKSTEPNKKESEEITQEKERPQKEKGRIQEDKPDDECDEDDEEGNDFGEEEHKEDDKNDDSYREDQNEDENYDDPGYYQYNDYRYRHNRDYDHRSAHYHQQQRMKFFNQQFIETLKKYPPDVFKCTFPQFFGMGGNQSVGNQGQGGSNSFANMPNLPFMSYMMSQFLNQNMGNQGVSNNQFNLPYHPGNQHYNQGQPHTGHYNKHSDSVANGSNSYPPGGEDSMPQRISDQHFRDDPDREPSRPSHRESGHPGLYQGYDNLNGHQMMMSSMQFPPQQVLNEFLGFNQGYRGGPSSHSYHGKGDFGGAPLTHQQFNIEQDFVVKDATGGLTSPIKNIPSNVGDQASHDHVANQKMDSEFRSPHQNLGHGGSEMTKEADYSSRIEFDEPKASNFERETSTRDKQDDQFPHNAIQNELDYRQEPGPEGNYSQTRDEPFGEAESKETSASKAKQKVIQTSESRVDPPVLRRSARKKGK